MKRYLFTYIFFLFFCFASQAQNWINFNDTNSPILENPRNQVAEDNNGVIWIKTDHTLISYDDGAWQVYDFRIMGLPFQSTAWGAKTLVDTLNHLWFLAENYLVEFDGTNFITHDTIGLGNYGNADLAINKKDNAIWFATGFGLVKYLGGTYTRFTSLNSGLTFDEVRDVTVDTNGWIWARVFDPTGFQPVVRFDNTSWWLSYQGIYQSSVWNAPRCIQADNYGNVWWGFENNIGIRKYFNGVLDTFPNQGSPAIITIGIDKVGNPWFELVSLPLFIFHYDGSSWVYDDGIAQGMPLNCQWVYSFAFDNFGNTWMGTNYGVVVFNPNGLNLQTPHNTSHNQSRLYPSLTEKEITIDGEFAGKKLEIKIFDALGKVMLYKSETSLANKFLLDVEWLPAGLYYIQITIDIEGTYSAKFVKQ